MNDTAELVNVTLTIDNVYEDTGETITTIVETEIPAPPADQDSDAYYDWEDLHIRDHTGTDHPGGDAGYFVTVRQSSDPERLKPGTTFEFV